MKAIKNRTIIMTSAATAMLGLALISLASCSSGDSTTPAVTTGGSAALQGPLVFVNNTGDKTLSTVALRGDLGNSVIGILSGVFGGSAIGDMQVSEGEWLFVNLGGANSVALIDPLSAATPVFEKNTQVGNRPVHIYRDPIDGEVIWTMIDGPAATGVDDVEAIIPRTPPPNFSVNCSTTNGGAVTIFHNSHTGSGGEIPKIIGKVCLYAKGHKVAAFSSGTGVSKRAFVSSEDSGEIAVIDNDETSSDYLKMISRIDLCKDDKESTPCDDKPAPPLTTALSPNISTPHGIRWSKHTNKVYSIQEGYHEIAEIDPNTLAVMTYPDFNLLNTPYTGFGISPDGRFLLLRGETTIPTQAIKLAVIDLDKTPPVKTEFDIQELNGTTTGSFATGSSSFKFSPDGNRFYLLVGNSSDPTVKKDRLFAFNSSTLTATPPALTLLGEIPLLQTGRHSMDVLAQGATGAGEAKYIVVSNTGTPGTVSIINATTNTRTQDVSVGPAPGTVLVYYPGAASAGNQATASLTGGLKTKPSMLPERLDDHGMPE